MTTNYTTQNDLLLNKLLDFYDKNNDKDCAYDELVYLFNNILIDSNEEDIKKYINKNVHKLKYNSMDPYLLAHSIIAAV